jgi:hypothetical protein
MGVFFPNWAPDAGRAAKFEDGEKPHRIMSGWHSLQSVATLHTVLQVAGLLVAAAMIASGMTAYHFWSRWEEITAIAERARAKYIPRWRLGDTATALHNGFIEIAILGIAALLAIGYAASAYGSRKVELAAAAQTARVEQARGEADTLRRALAANEARSTTDISALRDELQQAEERHNAETAILRQAFELAQPRSTEGNRRTGGDETEARLAAEIATLREANDQAAARHAAEIAELQRKLNQAETRRVAVTESLRWEVKQAERKATMEISRLREQLAGTERKLAALQARRRLSIEEKYALIDALRPFAGQKVMIAAIAGDDDGRVYAQDFVEVFDAAGWEHAAVTYRHFERDPVGVEITLNEHDGRAGRINSGVGALINIARKLSLTDGNTIYMTAEVPAGQVQLKIGKKLPR